ncbi:hypothetical protein [Geoalkalibacter halelectricus]|uniref:hypothetical protein n=1 Tax=Geoalkalibacter halelectricus TaxID=2847045 RepID=UPI003D1D9CEF
MPRSDLNMAGLLRVKAASPTHSCGWQLRIRRNGELISKFFSDRYLGGEQESLRAALAERERLLARYPSHSRYELAQRPKASVATGVRRIIRRRNGKIYHYWLAGWQELPWKWVSRCFSIQRYGEQKAKQMADEACRNAQAAVIRGVRRVRRKTKTRRGTRVSACWVASWTPEPGGREFTRSFSVAKYGEQKAYELALAKRQEEIEKLSSQL